MSFSRVLPAIIVLLGLLPASAETLNLTLQQAIQMALAKNFRIKVEEFAPKIAKSQQLSASGQFDPTLSASYTYDHSEQELRSLNPGLVDPAAVPGQVVPDLFARHDGQEINASIAGTLPTGTTYSIGPTLTMTTDNQRNPQFTEFNSFFGVSMTQPLLKNFGTDVNLASIRVARANQAISQWQLRQQVIDVVTDTISIYSELYFSIQNVEVEKRSRALAAQLVDDNIKREQGGVMIDLDVMQAKTDLADREERVLVAERAVADNENFLKQLVTDEIAGLLDTHLDIVQPELANTEDPDRKHDYARAFDLRPDYRQALLDIQKRQINVVFTRNQALPQLDLVGSLGLNGIDTTFLASAQRVSGQGNRNLAGNIGAVFSLPIPNRTAQGNLQVSKLEVLQALMDLKRLEQTILVEADNAAGQIDTTRKRIEATSVASDFARQTLQGAQARLNNGRSTTFEVLQFQRDLAAAEVNEARARADFIQALARYARLTGSTLERNGIVTE